MGGCSVHTNNGRLAVAHQPRATDQPHDVPVVLVTLAGHTEQPVVADFHVAVSAHLNAGCRRPLNRPIQFAPLLDGHGLVPPTRYSDGSPFGHRSYT